LADNKGEGRKVDAEEEGGDLILPKAKRSFTASFRLFFKSLGPGLVTGASDDDPSDIATYSQAGSQFGFWNAMVGIISISTLDSSSRNVCKDRPRDWQRFGFSYKKEMLKKGCFPNCKPSSYCRYNKHRSGYRFNGSINQACLPQLPRIVATSLLQYLSYL
jgi:hypothetical protein